MWWLYVLLKQWNIFKRGSFIAGKLLILFCFILFCSVLFCSVLFCSVLFCSEGDIGVCGIAVLGHFSCGISGILISNCGIAVFSGAAGCGFLAFWAVSKIIVKVLLRFPSFFYPPRLFRKQAKTECQTSSVTRVIIWNVIVSDYEQYWSINNVNVSSANSIRSCAVLYWRDI